MKKIFYLILLSFLLSCSFPHYMIENKAQTTGLDFTKGKWLINDIDCPSNVYKEFTEMSSKDFRNYLQDRLYPLYEVKGIILPQKIDFNPSKKTLKDMKKGCNDFDYFINIKARKLKEDIAGLDLTPHRTNNRQGANESEVLIEVYNLNLSEIIYSQKVIGITTTVNDNQDVHLSKNSRSLLFGAYNKIMRDIDKKSIKN